MDNIVKHLAGLVEAKIELAKIEIKEQVALIASKVAYLVIIILLGLLLFITLNIGIATALNAALNSPFWGYFIVAGFWGIVLAVLIFMKKPIADKIHAMVADMLMNDEGGPNQDPKVITNARPTSVEL